MVGLEGFEPPTHGLGNPFEAGGLRRIEELQCTWGRVACVGTGVLLTFLLTHLLSGRVHLYLGAATGSVFLSAKGGSLPSPRPPWRFQPTAATCASHPPTKCGCRSPKKRSRIAGSVPVAPAAHSGWPREPAG